MRGTRHIRGLTLIESLVAMTILASGIGAAVHVFLYSTVTQIRAERQSRASFLLVRKTEELRLAARDVPAPGGTLDPENPAPGFHESFADEILCVWQVAAGRPVRIRVAVYSVAARRPVLLAQAATTVADRF